MSTDTSEHGLLSAKQSSAEFYPVDSDVVAQAITVTDHHEVGTFSEAIDCVSVFRD